MFGVLRLLCEAPADTTATPNAPPKFSGKTTKRGKKWLEEKKKERNLGQSEEVGPAEGVSGAGVQAGYLAVRCKARKSGGSVSCGGSSAQGEGGPVEDMKAMKNFMKTCNNKNRHCAEIQQNQKKGKIIKKNKVKKSKRFCFFFKFLLF